MAAANESQGLKIAVAVFVALTVILAVTTYFGFDNASKAEAKLKDSEDKLRTAASKLDTTGQQLKELMTTAGYGNLEEYTAAKDAMKKDEDKLGQKLAELNTQVAELVNDYKAKGGSDQKVQELQGSIAQLIGQYQAEPGRTYQSKLNRLVELLSNQVRLAMALEADNQGLRQGLETSVDTNNQKLSVETGAKQKAEEDLRGVTTKNEEDRRGLLVKVDELQTQNQQLSTAKSSLENDLNRQKIAYEARIENLNKQLRYFREQSEKREIVLGQPSGKVTYVDYNRNEVRVNLTRSQGAREQMVFSVFDRDSPGLPTDRPKAIIELITVGSRDSVARIDLAKTKNLSRQVDTRTGRFTGTIRSGDLIYSPAFNPNDPKKFALIGKMDVNRDGVDDREDLKRLIRNGGGEIVYDLPPASIAKESGSIEGTVSYYVIDERKPIRPLAGSGAASVPEDKDYENKLAAVRQRLRDSGVPPMPIERLLDYLGYTPGVAPPVPGRVEAINRELSESLLKPKGRAGATPPPATTTPSENAGDDMPTEPDADEGEPKG